MTPCDQCDGSGWVWVEAKGGVVECSCRAVRKLESMLAKCGLPERYQQASFDNFKTAGVDRSVKAASLITAKYVDEFPLDRSRGLLFVGPVGVGKTHLAIAALRALTLKYTARTYFADFRDLLKRIQATFDGGGTTRAEVLKPVMGADVIVIDELGAARSTDWTFEIAEEIINFRYNAAKATIFTSNLPNLPGAGEQYPMPQPAAATGYGRMVAEAVRGETLGDRLGARMFSRLQEMCRPIEISGEDFRRKQNR
jgi:DNA replication protein DnaC